MSSVFVGCRDATQLYTASATADCKTRFLDSHSLFIQLWLWWDFCRCLVSVLFWMQVFMGSTIWCGLLMYNNGCWQLIGSIPGLSVVSNNLLSCSLKCGSITKLCNLILAKGCWITCLESGFNSSVSVDMECSVEELLHLKRKFFATMPLCDKLATSKATVCSVSRTCYSNCTSFQFWSVFIAMRCCFQLLSYDWP